MSRPFSVLQPALFHFDSAGSSVARSIAITVPSADEHADRASGAGVASPASIVSRPIDPMLLVYEERLQTVCQLARWVGRAFRSILRAARGQPEGKRV